METDLATSQRGLNAHPAGRTQKEEHQGKPLAATHGAPKDPPWNARVGCAQRWALRCATSSSRWIFLATSRSEVIGRCHGILKRLWPIPNFSILDIQQFCLAMDNTMTRPRDRTTIRCPWSESLPHSWTCEAPYLFCRKATLDAVIGILLWLSHDGTCFKTILQRYSHSTFWVLSKLEFTIPIYWHVQGKHRVLHFWTHTHTPVLYSVLYLPEIKSVNGKSRMKIASAIHMKRIIQRTKHWHIYTSTNWVSIHWCSWLKHGIGIYYYL